MSNQSKQNNVLLSCHQLIQTEEQLLKLAETLAKACQESVIIFLFGPLGAGKTTLVRGFLRGLHYQGKVKSPTYTLLEQYEINHTVILHFDFYRILNPEELKYVGLADYFSQNAICLIEWPDKAASFLPDPDIACHLDVKGEMREIKLIAHSLKGKEILLKLY